MIISALNCHNTLDFRHDKSESFIRKEVKLDVYFVLYNFATLLP